MTEFDFSYFADDPTTFDQAPIPIAVLDARRGTIAYINDTFSAILGRSRHELLGVTGQSITHPADVVSSTKKIEAFLESDETHAHIEKRYLRPDGSSVWVDVTFFRSGNAERRNFYIAVATNLSERKKKQDLLDTRTHDLDKTREAVINSMAILSEFRDRETGEHITRTRLYFRLILDRIPYALPFSRKAISLIANSAVLHDIGKVGIPDHILLKPGKLTREEFDIMKTHTTLGSHAIMRTQRTMEKDTFLMFAKEIAEFHHERWDGTGYPLGLAGGRDSPHRPRHGTRRRLRRAPFRAALQTRIQPRRIPLHNPRRRGNPVRPPPYRNFPCQPERDFPHRVHRKG